MVSLEPPPGDRTHAVLPEAQPIRPAKQPIFFLATRKRKIVGNSVVGNKQ
jgi:hypothetical protein